MKLEFLAGNVASASTLRTSTKRQIVNLVRLFVRESGVTDVEGLQPLAWRKFVSAHPRPATNNQILVQLRRLLVLANQAWRLEQVSPERHLSKRRRCITPDEVWEIRRHLTQDYWTLFVMLLETWCRVSELLSLRISDHEPRLHRVHVPAHVAKTGRERWCYLGPHAETLLDAIRRPQDDDRLVGGGRTRQAVWKALRKAYNAIGAPDLDVHSLRVSGVTVAVADHDEGQVALQSGHVLRGAFFRYVNPLPHRMREMAVRVEDEMFGRVLAEGGVL